MSTTTITEDDLRAAIRDPRYWRPNPEREAFTSWVTGGFQALNAGGEARRSVRVRAYERTREGKRESVSTYVQERRAAVDWSRPQPVVPALPTPANSVGVLPTRIFFIGGGGDRRLEIVKRVHDTTMNDLLPRRSSYHSHDDEKAIRAAISAEPSGTRIVLVGHSWGGDTAAQIAAELGRSGRQVDTLVTVDPVGQGTSEDFFRRVRAGAREWINVRAVGGSAVQGSNLAAFMGGRYGDGPRTYATRHIEAPFVHQWFNTMLQFRDASGRTAWEAILGQ